MISRALRSRGDRVDHGEPARGERDPDAVRLGQARDRVPRPVGAVPADPELRRLTRVEVADELQEHRVGRFGVASGVGKDRGVLERQPEEARLNRRPAGPARDRDDRDVLWDRVRLRRAYPVSATTSSTNETSEDETMPARGERKLCQFAMRPLFRSNSRGERHASVRTPTLGALRDHDPARRARLRELRGRRLGARAVRPGTEPGPGVRADGRRVGAGDRPLRHCRRVRRRAQRADDRRLDAEPRRAPAAHDKDVQPDGRGRRPRARARASGAPARIEPGAARGRARRPVSGS